MRREPTLKRDGSVCISLTRKLSPMRVAMLQCCTVGVKSTLRSRHSQTVSYDPGKLAASHLVHA